MRIVAAALKVKGVVYTLAPKARHHTLIRYYVKVTGKPRIPSGTIQGFVTDEGRFVNRKKAAVIAFEAKQIPEPKDELFTEDLW